MKSLLSKVTLAKFAQSTLVIGMLLIMGVSTYTSNDKLGGKREIKIKNDTSLVLNEDTLRIILPKKNSKGVIIIVHVTR